MPLNHSSKCSEPTNEQFMLIGKIVVEFSNLEFLLSVLLSRLLITPEFLGRIYTDQIAAYKILEAIDNALEIHSKRYNDSIISKQKASEIKDVINLVKTFRPLRNKFAHYCWSRSNDQEIFGTKLSGKLPSKKKPSPDSITVKNSALKLQYEKAFSAVDSLQKILSTLPELLEDSNLKKKLTKTK